MNRQLMAVLVSASMFLSGCLYVAPIEEEDNVLPYINSNAVNPSLGAVEVELSGGGELTITLSAYGDENAEQTLYHRMVMDFRPSGEKRIIATEPRYVEPGNRDRIMYQFRPCTMSNNYSSVIQEGKTIDLYLLLSDERFINDTEITIGKEGEFQQPFKTNPENHAVWVQWSLIFNGLCPEG